jgi:hypothetical protein
MNVARLNQTASLLTNGQLLVTGGYNACTSSCIPDATSELFDPQSGSFTSSQGLSTARSQHTATLLTDGSVLLVGGINAGVTLSSTDSYQPASFSLPQLASITISPANSTLPPGTSRPLAASGYDGSGNLIGTLQSTIWNSSAPSIATVSNAAGSAGIVTSLNPGTTTVTASIGTVSASTQVTVTPPLVSISLSPANGSILLSSPQGAQLTATGIYSDGSSKNVTSYATWTTSNTLVAAVMQSSSVQGVVVPVGVGTADITAILGTFSASTSISVVATPSAPVVSNVTPVSGVSGTQVTISGSGFGATQGSGNVILGSAQGMVVSWSDTQVVATVANGAVSGIALVQQSGVESNSLNFTVSSASLESVTPTSGLAGTQVTITGSGFGASQSGGIVWLGTAPGTITSWSDSQIVATVAAGSASGSAQVLQSGVWSNSVPFTINLPHITGITPNAGSAGTVVTVTGSGFGTTQGSGNVWIGNTYGSVVGWSDTQVVASVASSAVSGVVKIEQDATWSNAVAFTVPPSLGGGITLTIVPNVISLVVGDTRSIQAVDSSGNPVTGLTWISSNTAVATLSTDDPPIITAVAAGNVSITGGSASADLTVFSGPTLPLGTTIWSNPGDGSGVYKIIPAVPSSTGVADVFAMQTDGTVQAITSDGTLAWSASVGTNSKLLPDFQGGLTVVNNASVKKLDGMTGIPQGTYTLSNSTHGIPSTVVHTDGTIFTIDVDSVVGVDPSTGLQKFKIPMTHSTGTTTFANGTPVGPCQDSSYDQLPTTGTLMIAGDGYAYVVYQYSKLSSVVSPQIGTCTYLANDTTHVEEHERLLRVGSDGSSQEIAVADWSSDGTVTYIAHDNAYEAIVTGSGYVPERVIPNLITNADQGVLVSLYTLIASHATFSDVIYPSACTFCPPPPPIIVASNGVPETVAVSLVSIAGGSVTSNVTLPSQIQYMQPVLQAQDGTYFGQVDYDWDQNDDFLAAFDQSGHVKWSKPGYYAQIATSDGGVIAQSYSGQSYKFDANGDSTGQTATLNPPSSGSRVGQWPGWLGNSTGSSYAIASGKATSISSAAIGYAITYAALPGGNHGGTGTSVQQEWFPQLPSCLGASTFCAKEALVAARDSDSQIGVGWLPQLPASGL